MINEPEIAPAAPDSTANGVAKAPLNLSIDDELAGLVKTFVVTHKRKGRRNVSELTETLYIALLRREGVKLPPRFAFKSA